MRVIDAVIGRCLAAAYLLFVAAFFGAMYAVPIYAQHNHERGHNDYKGWSSGKTPNCCDNQDCGALKDDEVRQTDSGTEVLISGEWCPVLRQHWTKPGARSPDWNTAHACIRKSSPTNCERLLCFMGKGGF
jgi:hypothetical protein